MKSIRYRLTGAVALALALSAGAALAATPTPNGAKVRTQVFNDCILNTQTVTNNYPSNLVIEEGIGSCGGGANRDVWYLSSDGGATKATFDNNSLYHFGADLVISGSGTAAEAGLMINPWWDADFGGVFNCRVPDGEIAVFNDRLPFYSFTTVYGLHYAQGTVIRLEVVYNPHTNSLADPATIEYIVRYLGTTYSSGPIAFDQGNPAEDPPHGQWGELQPTTVGGHVQVPNSNQGGQWMRASWSNITLINGPTTPASTTTWSKLKRSYR